MLLTASTIGFESYEKRLEISFFKCGVFANPGGLGVRELFSWSQVYLSTLMMLKSLAMIPWQIKQHWLPCLSCFFLLPTSEVTLC